jgi:hypothetical protein
LPGWKKRIQFNALNTLRLLDLFIASMTFFACAVQAETSTSPLPNEGASLEGVISLQGISGPVREGVSDSRPLPNIAFEVMKGDVAVASFTTDAEGRFHVSLPPGHYRIARKDWKSRVGFFGPFEVEITAGHTTSVQWNCQSGIQ